MKKIPTVFVRNPEDRMHVTDEVNPGCEWVLAGEGVATRKYDGTCVMLDENGEWWARREVKKGKAHPPNYVPEDFDEVTGKTQGWEPIGQSSFAHFHSEAVHFLSYSAAFTAGTYELIGPKINGNPEHAPHHLLIKHDVAERYGVMPAGARAIKDAVRQYGKEGREGVVWHHPDGRMAKLKARDLT